MSRAFLIVEFASHLDHRPPKSGVLEQALRDCVPLCGREYDAWRTAGLERFDRCIEQHSTDALPAMRGIDNDVVQRSRRSTQRHVIGSFYAGVGVANRLAVTLGDKDHNVRLT